MTEWRAIPSLNGVAEASINGDIRTLPHVSPSGRDGQPSQKRKGFLLRPYVSKSGYLVISIKRDGRRRKFLVHRLVAEAFQQGFSDDLTVDHLDGNKLNNAACNLEWVSREENSRRQNADGRGAPVGEAHPSAKLKNKDIPEIFSLRESGLSLSQIARRFGVSVRLVHRILKGERRRHLAQSPVLP